MTTKTLGDRGEDLTGDYLLAHGCTLLDRQWPGTPAAPSALWR